MNAAVKKPYRELSLVDAGGHRKAASKHNMNRKADKRLSSVANFFQEVIPECTDVQEEELLCKVISFENCEPLDKVFMLYDVENRFAAISYNLLLQSFVSNEEDRAYKFELKYDGVLAIKDAKFVNASEICDEGDQRAEYILDLLNNPIVLKKIRSLNLLQAVLQYFPDEKRWGISVKSLPGSATWILIPPMMNLISPKRQEVYSLVEIMRMLSSAVMRRS